MSAEILDHVQDVAGTETHRLTTLYDPPDFVKNASTQQLNGAADMALHLFADPSRKLYPCHSSAATWMSACTFYDKQASFTADKAELIERRILSAADFHGVRGRVDALKTKIAADRTLGEESLPDDAYAIVWDYSNGTKERHWPLRNAREVDFAAHHFQTHHTKFAFADRFRVAQRIMQKAAQLDVPLTGYVDTFHKYAGEGRCSAADAATMCESRAKMARQSHPEHATAMQKVAQDIRDNPSRARQPGFLLKLADAVDQFDIDTHLDRLYDAGGLSRPEDTLFAVTEKLATDFVEAHVQTLTGNVYSLPELEKIAIEHVRGWMGDEFVTAVTVGELLMDGEKLAAVVPTLDRGAAGMFDRMAEEAAVRPVLLDKAAQAGLSHQELADLAARYRPSRGVRAVSV